MSTRRQFVSLAALALPGMAFAGRSAFADLPASLARLERANGGRLGVAVVDVQTGNQATHRGAERFPMCSTFKFLLASAVLQRVDRRKENLARTLEVPAAPLLGHSPLTEPHAGGRMTVEALCQAVLLQSDNTAANLLLETLGGPPGITHFARTIGDPVTRLDRTELTLNESLDHDPRDTTSPTAMAGNLRAILLGEVLSSTSRAQITRWMQDSLTGLDRLRAKLPAGWRAADKTGSNGEHTSNDIAVFWPDAGGPVIVTAYITQCTGPEDKRASLLSQIGELVFHATGQSTRGQ